MQKSSTGVGEMPYRRYSRRRRQIRSIPTRSFAIRLKQPLTPKQIDRVFELAKLDYARLGTQEQSIIDSRWQIWVIFIGIIAGPASYAGVVGLRGSVVVLALIPFFVSCLSLHVKHDEMVLKYDIRRNLKSIAREWHYQNNHDSKFSQALQQEHPRWWQGWYRLAMGAVFVFVEIADAAFVHWYLAVSGLQLLSIGVAVGDALLIAITSLCLLFHRKSGDQVALVAPTNQ